jgi:hypothetical protein
MTAMQGKKGRDLLAAVIGRIRDLDPKIVPFDSDEVAELEAGVLKAVRDVFGEGSLEFTDFEEFRILAGHVSRGDSRTEKQAKFELGLPHAISRLEELFERMATETSSGVPVRELSSEDLVEVGSPEKTGKTTSKDPSGSPRKKPASRPPGEPSARAPSPPGEAAQRTSRGGAPGVTQPGKVLLLQSGGDDITFSVTALMDKIGIDVILLEEDSPVQVEEIASGDTVAFTLMCVSSTPKGGLSGLTAVIAKPRPKHEVAFKLGLLVGRLGAGKVGILFSGEKPLDIPEELFGVVYLPYQEEGGWQIGLLKLLKKNGFLIDANLLFE